MANIPIHNLSKDDMQKAYAFIYLFEKEIKPQYGTFDFENHEIDLFCKENGIKKKERRNTKATENYFWFKSEKKGKVNDIAYNLLRHIRNAMAHGNFKKEKGQKSFYILEDYSVKTHKRTMYGKIDAALFWDYLNIVAHSSQLIDNEINFK